MQARARMAHSADTKNLVADLQAFRPTFVLSVPRVFEKVYNTAKQKAHADGKGAIFDRAERVAIAYSEALEPRAGPAWLLRGPARACSTGWSTRKLRAALGGRCRRRDLRRRAAGRPAGPLLPRHRRHRSTRATA